MIEYIILFLVLLAFLIASIEDIKKREVYDYINYSLAFLVLITAIFESLFIGSFDPIKYVGFGLLIGFLFGSILFYAGIWGGGDAKFLIGFGAASYYLMKFINVGIDVNGIYFRIVEMVNYGFNLFLDFFLDYIIFIDIIFLVLIILMFFKIKERKQLKNLVNLFTILFLLFLGLYLDYSNLVLVIYGFVAFLLIFFGDEEIFFSVYLKIKKKIINLAEGDMIDTSIKMNNKTLIDVKEGHLGLIKEHILKIRESNISDKKFINIRKILPYSILIGLNYLVYMLKIITLDETNLTILAYLLKFLFYSFLAGGILAILILFYYYVKNFKKVKLSFSLFEKGLIIFLFSGSLIMSFFSSKFLLFLGFIFLIFFIKVARAVEGMIFIKKKSINEVVLGDWIAQDIIVKGKVLFSQDDFKLGINEKQLEKIISLSKINKDLKYIFVKDGLAFLPPLFVGFLIILLL